MFSCCNVWPQRHADQKARRQPRRAACCRTAKPTQMNFKKTSPSIMSIGPGDLLPLISKPKCVHNHADTFSPPTCCLVKILQLLWIQERMEKDMGMEEVIFWMPDRHWWEALQLVHKAGKESAYILYRCVTAQGKINVFYHLQYSLQCRRFMAFTLKWRWLAYRVCQKRGLVCNSSYVLWPRYQGQPGIRYHRLVMQAVQDASQYPIFRYEDVLGLYCMPHRPVYFNEFEAFCDVILNLHVGKCEKILACATFPSCEQSWPPYLKH